MIAVVVIDQHVFRGRHLAGQDIPAACDQAATAGRSYVNEYGITYSDVARLDSTIPGIRRVLPMRIIRDEVRFNNLVQQAQIIGTHPIYAEMTGVDLVRGRFLSEAGETHMNNVCVLTMSLAENLFPYQDPLEEEVKIGADYFTVVGLLRERSTAEKRPQSGAVEGFHARLEGTDDTSRLIGCDVCVLADSARQGESSGEAGLALVRRLLGQIGTAPIVAACAALAGVQFRCNRRAAGLAWGWGDVGART